MLSGLYARLIGLAVILAALAGAWFYVHHLQTEVATLTTAKTLLEGKIKDQNDAVEALKRDADARLATAQAAIDAAKAETVAAKKKATIIYKTQPSTPGASCDADRKSTLDLLNGAAK